MIVLEVMKSVHALPIMHMFVHLPKPVLDSSHMKALDTNLFDFLSKTHELRDFKKVVAVSSSSGRLLFTNARSYSDSSRFGSF